MNLTDLFDEMARDVRVVDLTERTLATSRRIGRHRAALACTAAFAAVTVAAGAAAVALPRGHHAPPPPAGSPSASARPAKSWPSSWTGHLYYVATGPSGHGLYEWTPGQASSRKIMPLSVMAGNSITLSPDGTKLAWVDGNPDDTNGTLYLADADGNGSRAIAQNIDGADLEPAWQHDSRHLLVAVGATTSTQWVIDSGSGAKIKQHTSVQQAQHPRIPAAASLIVWLYPPSRNSLATTALSGDGRHEIAVGGLGAATYVDGVTSVSPDGRYAAVKEETESDPNVGPATFIRPSGATALIDLTTGHPVHLDYPGTLHDLTFLRDGRLLIRSTVQGAAQITLTTPDFQPVGTTTDTSGLDGYLIGATT